MLLKESQNCLKSLLIAIYFFLNLYLTLKSKNLIQVNQQIKKVLKS